MEAIFQKTVSLLITTENFNELRNTYENDRCKFGNQPRKTVPLTVDGFYPRIFCSSFVMA